jgi:type VI secretion system protein ImpM
MPGTEITEARVPGLHGKLPARGDFVSRRLDADFVAEWDAWLQRMMSESREALGERWLECFLSAPVWRFVLPAGMFSRRGWAGLMLPSVDRVGRYFPLTIAAPIREESIDGPSTLRKALPWLDVLETLSLEALAPQLDFEEFDRRLGELAMPDDVAVLAGASDDTVPLGAATAARFEVWQLAGPPDAAIDRLVQERSLPERASALWMTNGGETVGACIAACGGLISGAQFCAMLDGRWQEHSWTLARELSCDPITRGVDCNRVQGKSAQDPQLLDARPEPSSEHETAMDTKSEQ